MGRRHESAAKTGSQLGVVLLGAALVLSGMAGCAPSHPPIVECRDAGGLHVVCGLQNPEDLALLPGGREVIVSQFGSMDGSRSGNLALFDVETENVRVAYEGGGSRATGGAQGPWGDAACPGPPEARFSPHGIDLSPLPDENLRLLVVNHGSREAVEFFEVRRGLLGTSLAWRGCAPAPSGAFLNDVVSLPGGGFLVTHMMPRGNPTWGMFKAAIGLDTGHVYEWLPGRGYGILPGSEAPFPNGIELSPDGRTVYLNLYSPGEVRAIERATGAPLGTADVPSPDNLTWSGDGRLLVASHRGGLADQLACMGLETGACAMEFAVVALDPNDMTTEIIFQQAGPPMGAGTVALDLGDGDLLIGSFAADRLLRVHVPR